MVEPKKQSHVTVAVYNVCAASSFFFCEVCVPLLLLFFCEVCVPLLIVRCRCLAYYYCALLSLSNIIFGLV
jgi:hypothetical protein